MTWQVVTGLVSLLEFGAGPAEHRAVRFLFSAISFRPIFSERSIPCARHLIIGTASENEGRMINRLPLARLEPENDSSRWLRRMSPVVGVQAPDAKIGVLVDIASILSA